MLFIRRISCLVLISALTCPGCGGGRTAVWKCAEAGNEIAGSDGCPGSTPNTCVDARVEGELNTVWLSRRPFWVDEVGLHVAHVDRNQGILWHSLSRETGEELPRDAVQVFPSSIDPAFWRIDAVAASPQGDLAFAWNYTDEHGYQQDRVLSVSGESRTVWSPRWSGRCFTAGLGWDGEAFTVSLLDADVNWAAARFSSQPTGLEEAEFFVQAAARYRYYDSETDAQSGTTVFAGAAMPGVVVVGRRGRSERLTASESGWQLSTGRTAGWATGLALNGATALIAWAESDLVLREISLETGEVLQGWTLPIDPGANVFEQIAVTRAGDRWIWG